MKQEFGDLVHPKTGRTLVLSIKQIGSYFSRKAGEIKKAGNASAKGKGGGEMAGESSESSDSADDSDDSDGAPPPNPYDGLKIDELRKIARDKGLPEPFPRQKAELILLIQRGDG